MKKLCLLLPLCLALVLGGCTLRSRAEPEITPEPTATAAPATPAPTPSPSPVPTPSPSPTPSPTPTPVPTPCPHLVWVDGHCAVCGEECAHPAWEGGRCTVCSLSCRHPEHDSQTLVCTVCGQTVPHNFLNSKCDMCGTVPQFRRDVVFRSTFTADAPAGSVDTLTYRTHDYFTEGQTRGYAPLEKKMTVYLPAGYDPSEKYDLMILMHGMGGTETYWLENIQQVVRESGHGVYTVGMLNNLMNSGYCRKMIIACPCFYRDGANQLDYFLPRDEDQFVRELRESVLPLLVDTYSTYARSSSQEDISAAREHFAYAGLSMGSIYAYTSILPKCLDLFAWFGCFSGSDAYLDKLIPALQSPENAQYPILYFYNSIGEHDSMFDTHTKQYDYLVNHVDCLTDGKNAAMTVINDASHEYRAWGTGLYNFLRVVFAQPEEP